MAGNDEQEDISQVEEAVDDDNADKSQTTDATTTDRLIHLPLTRVKHIIKSDPDVSLASQEAVIMLSKACVSKQGRQLQVIWLGYINGT